MTIMSLVPDSDNPPPVTAAEQCEAEGRAIDGQITLTEEEYLALTHDCATAHARIDLLTQANRLNRETIRGQQRAQIDTENELAKVRAKLADAEREISALRSSMSILREQTASDARGAAADLAHSLLSAIFTADVDTWVRARREMRDSLYYRGVDLYSVARRWASGNVDDPALSLPDLVAHHVRRGLEFERVCRFCLSAADCCVTCDECGECMPAGEPFTSRGTCNDCYAEGLRDEAADRKFDEEREA